MNRSPDDPSSSESIPLLCWNRRRRYGVAAVVLLLIAIPLQYVLRFGLFGFIISVFGVIVAMWIILKQAERGINRKPGDCRYATACDTMLGLVILWLSIVLQGIDVAT